MAYLNVELNHKTCARLIKINYENVHSVDTKQHLEEKRLSRDPDELSVNQINESQSGRLASLKWKRNKRMSLLWGSKRTRRSEFHFLFIN